MAAVSEPFPARPGRPVANRHRHLRALWAIEREAAVPLKLFVLDASLPGGFVAGRGDLRCAQTMAFTTLMLFQISWPNSRRTTGT